MRTTTRRLPLPLVAVVAAGAVLGVVAVVGGDRRPADGGPGAAAAGAASGQTGAPSAARQAGAARGDPASNPATAGLPRVAGVAATTDVVMVWNHSEVAVTSAVSGPAGPGAGAQIKLDLTVRPAAGHALAVVRVRNVTTRRLALIGTLQLVVSGPGAPTVSRQRLNRPLPAAGASLVNLAFRPGNPGAYRIRAAFIP